MALTNAERQQRYRERRRQEAATAGAPTARDGCNATKVAREAVGAAAVTTAGSFRRSLHDAPSGMFVADAGRPAAQGVPNFGEGVSCAAVPDRRPAPHVDTCAVTVPLLAPELARLDHWRGCQPDQPSRGEAVRRLALVTLHMPSAA